MKIETLRNNRKILLITVVLFFVVLTIVISTSLAKYKTTQSLHLVSGTISYSPDDLIIESYVNGTLANGFPSSDIVTFSSVNCTNGATASFNEDDWNISVSNLTKKGTKCSIHFMSNLKSSAEYILAGKNFDTRTDFSTTLTSDTTGTVFTAKDDDGTSYYYAGAPTDNWFYFGGYYWRIIRINGDGYR